MSGVQSGPTVKGTSVRHPLTIAAQRCVRAFKKAWYAVKYEHEEVIETERITDPKAAKILARVCQDKSLAAPPRDQKTGEILITKGCVWYSVSAIPAVRELLQALRDYVQADSDDLHSQIATRYGPGRPFPSGNLPPDKNGWPAYGGTVGRLSDWHAFTGYMALVFADQCKVANRNGDKVIQYRPNEAYELFFDRMPKDIEVDLANEGAALIGNNAEKNTDSLVGWHCADYFGFHLGIRREWLSREAQSKKIKTRSAPPGYLDTQGKEVRKLYCLHDVLRLSGNKRGSGHARNKTRLR